MMMMMIMMMMMMRRCYIGIAHVITGVYYAWWICDVRICIASRTSAILFSPSTGAVTDNCQSAKDTDTYFKTQMYMEDLSSPAVDGI